MPTGSSGVGNLIAAPPNGNCWAERGTTLFVDMATWEPWTDQWEYLSHLDRMTPRQVAASGRKDRVVVGPDVTRLEVSPATAIHPRVPPLVRAKLGLVPTIRDEDLTPELAAALRHSATIHNPAFYEAQRARRSTWSIPRFIQGFDVAINGDLILPRGLRHQAADLISQAASNLVSEDQRCQGTELDVSFLGDLDDRQTAAVDSMLAHEDGILHAPTGSGKTVMACAIIAERAVTTLVLINKTALASQWREQIRVLLGIKAGQLGGGRVKTRGQVDIMLLQTLARHGPDEIRELTAPYGQVIVMARSSSTSATTLRPGRSRRWSPRSSPPGGWGSPRRLNTRTAWSRSPPGSSVQSGTRFATPFPARRPSSPPTTVPIACCTSTRLRTAAPRAST